MENAEADKEGLARKIRQSQGEVYVNVAATSLDANWLGVGKDGSTVNATAVGAKVLELSEEEKAMNGAPEGELFVVEVLPRDKLPPLMSFEGGNTDKGAATFLVKSVLPALVEHAAQVA